MNKEKLAKEIIDNIGGKENVTHVGHCMTRLRFNLKDKSAVAIDPIKNLDGVMGVQFSGGQFQIIIGPGVEDLYETLVKLGDFGEQQGQTIKSNPEPAAKKERFSFKTILDKMMDTIAGCLTPILPILIVAGLIKMMAALVGPSMLNLAGESSDIYRLLTFVGDAGFYYFPVFVGLSGAKKFGSNQMIALLMGVILVHPTFVEIVASGEPFSVFGIPMTPSSYSSTVIPMILITWVMSYVEKYLKRFIPTALSTLLVPLLTVLIMLPLGLCLLGPLGTIIGLGLGNGLILLRELFGPFGVAIIGALYLPIVATGMHLPLIATALMSITTLGYDNTVLVGALVTVYTSLAISLGFMLKSKDPQKRSLGLSCFVSQSLGGVGEPTLFGIQFRYKRTIIYSMLGAFAGSLYAGFMNCAVYFVGASNFMAALGYTGGASSGIFHGVIACGIGFVVTFTLIMVFGYEPKAAVSKEESEPSVIQELSEEQ